MASLLPFTMDSTTLVFGPLDPSSDFTAQQDFLSNLRKTLLDNQALEWAASALTELPTPLKDISKQHPELKLSDDAALPLQVLSGWVRTGVWPAASYPLPNIAGLPLIVATHLSQYTQLLFQLRPNIQPRDHLPSILKDDTEVVGLCAGLLSSAAVANSSSLEQLKKNGEVAIRLAMIIGACVDAGDAGSDGESVWQSLLVGWTPSTETENTLQSILSKFSQVTLHEFSQFSWTT